MHVYGLGRALQQRRRLCRLDKATGLRASDTLRVHDREGPKKDITARGKAAADGPNEAMVQCFRDLASNLEANGGVSLLVPQACLAAHAPAMPTCMLAFEWLSAGDVWPARAASKAADVIAAYEEAVLSGKQLAPLKGIGKGTIAKVLLAVVHSAAAHSCASNMGGSHACAHAPDR